MTVRRRPLKLSSTKRWISASARALAGRATEPGLRRALAWRRAATSQRLRDMIEGGIARARWTEIAAFLRLAANGPKTANARGRSWRGAAPI